MRNIILFIILFHFLPFNAFGQKLEFDGEFLLFREAKTKQPVLIINDSLLYKGLPLKKIPFKHTEYPSRLQEYVPFNINKKTYLVQKGCGPVLEYRNDSIIRINDNYMQRNQFDAVHFVYNNEIYFFGGYGLFTTKNILTKYMFKTKDWIEVQTFGEDIQEPRSAAFSYLKGDDLFVFGGEAKDINQISSTKLLDNKIWKLHLPTMKWSCVGEYNQNSIKFNIINVFNDSRRLYFQSRQYFLEFDFFSNKIYTYERNYFPNVLCCYIEDKTLIGIYKVDSSTFFYAGDINEFKGKLKSNTAFIIPIFSKKTYVFIISVFLLFFILVLYYFRKHLRKIIKPYKGIIYSKSKKGFLYKGKQIIFEEQEKKILFYLLDNLNKFISLNELNQLFENNGNSESVSAIVKRREQAISGLLTKISKITGIDEKELIIERKNSEDKRIKDLKILPNLLKIL